MNVQELKKALHEGIVEFTYTKVNGTKRVAHGTLDFNKIDELGGNRPSGNGVSSIEQGKVAYFDTDKKAWRSFKEDLLIG